MTTSPVSAHVHPSAQVGTGVRIGEFAYIGENVVVGDDCLIESGARLGAIPFSQAHFASAPSELFPIVIGDGCRIGCNAVVQYGVEQPTSIKSGAWINHLCNIGHDVDIGERALVGMSVSISGHSTIGDDVRIGPGCTLTNRSVVGNGARIGIGSLVLHEVAEGTTVLGRPAVEREEYLESQRSMRSLAGDDRGSRPITGPPKGQLARISRLIRKALRWRP